MTKDNDNDKKDKNKIHSTTDYSKFKYIKGNRDLVEAHVKKLSDQIAKKDFQIPIIVNEKMEVCEGQHRLEAYKSLGMPITYMIKEGLVIQDIRKMNSTARAWTMQEFLDSHVTLGNKDYEVLKWFHEKYEFSISDSISMLNGKGWHSSEDLADFKDGNFKVTDLEWAKDTADKIQQIGEYFPYYKKRSFVGAIISALKDSTFVWKVFLSRLESHSSKLKNQGSRNDFILNIERLYNHNTSAGKKIRLQVYGNR
tara:strand:+ start:457 stop:1218 length:762 start_codon:yes stop_codon:yes gene_type:complete